MYQFSGEFEVQCKVKAPSYRRWRPFYERIHRTKINIFATVPIPSTNCHEESFCRYARTIRPWLTDFFRNKAADLAFPQTGKQAILIDQFVRTAFFHNAPLIDHDYPVHPGNG